MAKFSNLIWPTIKQFQCLKRRKKPVQRHSGPYLLLYPNGSEWPGWLLCKKVFIKTWSLSTFFKHLSTCYVKTETIPGFVLMSRVKFRLKNLLTNLWGPAGGLGARGHLKNIYIGESTWKVQGKRSTSKREIFMLKYERKQGNWTSEHIFSYFCVFGAFWPY